MDDTERAAYENLILLCPTHHTLIDGGNYTVEGLKEMKRTHEAKVLQSLADQNPTSKYPLALSTVINRLGAEPLGNPDIPVPTNAPNIAEKISYNHITAYKFVIEQYSVYQGKLGKIYEEIKAKGTSTKYFLLQNIKAIYLREKGKYPNPDELRANSDNIIESIKNELSKIADNSPNQNKDLSYEAIEFSLFTIIVDAFIRCDILEAPPET